MIPSIKSNMGAFLFMVILIPLAGELNFYPFNDFFRVSFGMPTFFFFLFISRKKLPPIISGIIVGISVVVFRILLELFVYDLSYSFQQHYPTFFYYFTFGSLYHVIRANSYINRPILIGILGILFDILASLGELMFQYISFHSITSHEDIQKISIIAIFRSFFVVGFLNLLILYKTRLKEEEIQKKNDQLTIVISNLYEESFNLKKTLINSENITRDAYNLYRLLKNVEIFNFDYEAESNVKLYQMALGIAGETHEIKKDNQRILAGLSRLITDKGFSEYMDIKKILNITIESNQKYANSLGKDIQILSDIQGEHPNYHIYQVFSILNNIIANAIESIEDIGKINIYVCRNHDIVEFHIKDNGPGIPENKIHLVFKPGFTNKYDNHGISFTGIGLTYTKELVESLEGEILLQSKVGEISGLSCQIRLPIKKLTLKG